MQIKAAPRKEGEEGPGMFDVQFVHPANGQMQETQVSEETAQLLEIAANFGRAQVQRELRRVFGFPG